MFDELLKKHVYRRKATLCPICYEPDVRSWCVELGQTEPLDEKICSLCGFWYEKISYTYNLCSIRIDGHLYWQELDPNPRGFQPFDGRKFSIRRNGSLVIEQVMMWYNGEIPDWAREDLPNNAEFV